MRPSKHEAANFISVWYSPPFGDGCPKMALEKMLYRIAASNTLLSGPFGGAKEKGRMIQI
jgi:hypothetical protein